MPHRALQRADALIGSGDARSRSFFPPGFCLDVQVPDTFVNFKMNQPLQFISEKDIVYGSFCGFLGSLMPVRRGFRVPALYQ